jgi:predicted CXXCH cytochrome family protein
MKKPEENIMMKKIPIVLLVILMVSGPPLLATADIIGTKHDFSSSGDPTGQGVGLSGDQICVVCHTPHHGATGLIAPLWNHTTTTATFTPYAGSGSLDATVGQPQGISLLCLSCHDGTVAIDAFGGAAGGPTMTGAGLVDTDLSNDHPVSFTYDAALVTADGGLNDPTTAPINGWLFGANSDQVECASCHDVHDNTNAPFLRMSNANSALCLTCHNK